MITLRDVSKTYHRKKISTEALKKINLQIEKGDIFGVIGYSGAGKSTLVRLVNYLERPTSGEITVDGKHLAELNPHNLREIKKEIGMIFQQFNLLESKTIFQNVAMPLILAKTNKQVIQERVTELLAFVGLADKAASYPSELSGGQKQRVGIARALASKPKILLCDEATSALDPQTTQSILDLLKKVNEEYGITILLITHEMAVIQQICNKVAVMEEGNIIEKGSVVSVFGKPKHPTTKGFVQTVVKNELPFSIKTKLKKNQQQKLYRLDMIGDHTMESIFYYLFHTFQLQVTVVFTNMTEIQDSVLAVWYIQVEGEERNKQQAWSFLVENQVNVEEITI
ncbi:methionine import ATP-binding protein MetN [Paraliobacillus ryukyuensis]|uniref:D-methionine transport system ATP-binding protein n=1 Tax=Paraliobacillus ryukyuensis TaxID=200904 RepID=A0A366EE38_9BACI|nr:ATP-binding cassette domain-containing protein [Paraliobacillus ryukyuensis]RBP00681.1 D-methionine transport system ATP-binding protein [Paraliobacillus ryukyuensis]